ncbi:MAG: inositol monophosphatase family protein [Herpetosiphon sp.]
MQQTSATLAIAIGLSREAGEFLRRGLGGERQLEYKSRADLVTDVDVASEQFLTTSLRHHFPDHAIVAEEAGGIRQGDWTWLIDPLDGTTNFSHGYPVCAVSLALLHRDEVMLGVVYDPFRDECFVAERNHGAWLGDRQLHVSTTERLDRALLSTGFPYSRWTDPRNNIVQFNRLILACQGILRSGSAAIDLANVAAGRSDGHWELQLRPWDSAAGALLVTEAGGTMTHWAGQPYLPWNHDVVATNGHLHAQLLSELEAAEHGDSAVLQP